MKHIYDENKILIQQVYQMKEYINKQENVRILWLITQLAQRIAKLLTEVIEKRDAFAQLGMEINEEYIFSVLNQMLGAQEAEDYILYGDILQLQMLPILLEIQNAIQSSCEDLTESFWDQNMDALKKNDVELYEQMLNCEALHAKSLYCNDVYSIENTNVGALTLAVDNGEYRIYLHSNENPMDSARQLIDAYYDPYKNDYVIYGLGLCYHCRYLASLDYDLDITIIENDIGILQLAMNYMDMSWYFNHPGVKIIYDGDWKKWGTILKEREDAVVLLHQPSVRRIKNQEIQQQIQKFMVHEGSMRARSNRMIRNFLYNTKHCELDITALQQDFRGKNVIIVGAGPSLDLNVQLLKEKKENTIILAMGAVCRKLYNLGIPMDYIIITDPKEISNGQIAGLEHLEIPMILMSTATKGVARYYYGKKYLLCQKGFSDAEQLATKKNLPLFETGGSVATTAVDMCIRFDVNKIIFVGMDLAYTDNKNHASGARDEGITDYSGMIMVEDVYGKEVPTTRPFLMYREWIERRIARKDVTMPVIDATEGGARIQGSEVRKLSDVL